MTPEDFEKINRGDFVTITFKVGSVFRGIGMIGGETESGGTVSDVECIDVVSVAKRKIEIGDIVTQRGVNDTRFRVIGVDGGLIWAKASSGVPQTSEAAKWEIVE